MQNTTTLYKLESVSSCTHEPTVYANLYGVRGIHKYTAYIKAARLYSAFLATRLPRMYKCALDTAVDELSLCTDGYLAPDGKPYTLVHDAPYVQEYALGVLLYTVTNVGYGAACTLEANSTPEQTRTDGRGATGGMWYTVRHLYGQAQNLYAMELLYDVYSAKTYIGVELAGAVHAALQGCYTGVQVANYHG